MAADVVVSRELKSLQDELSAAQRERSAASAVSPPAPPSHTEPVKESADEHELRDQLRELVNEVTSFFADAEKNISAHPTQSVIGAMLVGILIGRLLGRR
ncbi:MAG: hypothetical protein ABSC37_14125 [Xanthobacteraceae bacterium]|jgi:ElaB/YqjD/DUF883 family membrane-anchored ribosome-binding protein